MNVYGKWVPITEKEPPENTGLLFKVIPAEHEDPEDPWSPTIIGKVFYGHYWRSKNWPRVIIEYEIMDDVRCTLKLTKYYDNSSIYWLVLGHN